MLMLSRNIGKAVIIGGNIRVSVAQVNGCQVRLGIEAPRGVIVDREEIHQRRVAEGTAQDTPGFDIDDHLRMAADAKRYRWLRNQPCIGDTAHDLLAGRGLRPLAGEDLDSLIDAQLKKEMPHDPQEQRP